MLRTSDADKAQAYTPAADNAVKGKNVLCLVNPNSGRKDAMVQFEQVASVMLNKAGVKSLSHTVTTHAGHFAELGESTAAQVLLHKVEQGPNAEASEKTNDDALLPIPDVICIFGGDTSLVEFVNGLMKHATDSSMDLRSASAKTVLDNVSLAMIPTGSSNGLAACYDARSTFEAFEKLIGGPLHGAEPMDLMEITCVNASDASITKKVDVHCVNWGLLSDHADLTERKWRSLGLTIKVSDYSNEAGRYR
jgi:hypothetical protein